MATTQLQLAANRANALLSTGPCTDEGRLKSSANARTHGLTSRHALLPFETHTEYDAHCQSYSARFSPRSPIDHELVNELADLRWRLGRVPNFEVELLNAEFLTLSTEPEFQPLIKNLVSDRQIVSLAFMRLIERRVLPNLYNQEARLARRADKLQAQLENRRLEPPPTQPLPPAEVKEVEEAPPIQEPQIRNWKIEPIRAPAQPGRNELCPCNSGLKFKRCCLNKNAKMEKPCSLAAH